MTSLSFNAALDFDALARWCDHRTDPRADSASRRREEEEEEGLDKVSRNPCTGLQAVAKRHGLVHSLHRFVFER